MKVVILAGGFGTRISEESHLKPKPMIEIGRYPILVHIMRIYASQGFNDFVVCAGYKQQVIKEYFAHFDMYTNDVTFDFASGERKILKSPKFDWKVTIADTGLKTQTGGRIKRARDYIGNEPFLLTYGDAVGDIDINAVIESHKKAKKLATICVYNFGQTKGVVDLSNDGTVQAFREKSDFDGDLINIGFMVVEPQVIDMIEGKETVFEDVLNRLAKEGQLNAYVHKGFWQCMDTLREKEKLEALDASGKAPWKVWEK
jgi:glucose-1-phosphate cytidylyltransferase